MICPLSKDAVVVEADPGMGDDWWSGSHPGLGGVEGNITALHVSSKAPHGHMCNVWFVGGTFNQTLKLWNATSPRTLCSQRKSVKPVGPPARRKSPTPGSRP